MADKADIHFITLAQNGQRQAFGTLVERYEPMAQRLALRLLGDAETARERTQEAFLQAYLSIGDLQKGASFESWLYGIVRNVCMNYLRKKKADRMTRTILRDSWPIASDGLPISSPDALEVVEADDLHRCMLAAIKTLPVLQQRVLLLFYYQSLSIDAIAAQLDISSQAVKTRLFRARQALGSRLVKQYPEIVPLDAFPSRRKIMATVKLIDVVPAPRDGYYMAMLLDETHSRVLPILVSTAEGLAITTKNGISPRPTATDFMSKVLAETGLILEEIRIETLKQHPHSKHNILYAVAKVRNGAKICQVEARASEALAVAVRTNSAIVVDRDIMDQAGYKIPQELQETPEKMLKALTHCAFEFAGHQLTTRFQGVVQSARQEAQRLQHDYVGSEHLLLALLKEEEGRAAEIFQNLGLHREQTQQKIEAAVDQWNKGAGIKPAATERIAFVPRTQQVLALAAEEAAAVQAEVVDSGHLLLALAKVKEGVASQLLHQCGFGYEKVKEAAATS